MTFKHQPNFQIILSGWLGLNKVQNDFKISNVFVASLIFVFLSISPTVSVAQQGYANNDGWSVSGGAGIIFSPMYFGDDDDQFTAFPNINIGYGNKFEASIRGITYKLYEADGFGIGPVARYQFERSEDANDTSDLTGLDDVKGTIELGGFIGYASENNELRLEIRKGVNGHEGIIGEIEAKYNAVLITKSRPVFFSIGPLVTYGDNSYNSAYFDVNASQASLSGLQEFDAGDGFNTAGLEASIIYPLTQRLSLIVIGGYVQLLGDIAKSSLVRERGSRNQTTVGVLLDYRLL